MTRKMANPTTPNRLGDVILNGELKAGIARFTLNAAQAFCGKCNKYLTMFSLWDNGNYQRAQGELDAHIQEKHNGKV